jgi:hypothetical protein
MEGFKKFKWAGLACILFMTGFFSSKASAAPFTVLENFDYGASSASLSGLGGGTGFSTNWSSNIGTGYTPTGLTLSTSTASGGALSGTSGNGSYTYRTFTTKLPNDVYGSFLFKRASISGSDQNCLMLSSSTGNNNQTVPFAFNIGNGGDDSWVGGQPLVASVNTTYMGLFHVNSTTGATLWVLSSSQYDNFIASGMQESDLNSATIGSGATNVTDRGTRSVPNFSTITALSFYQFSANNVTYDRISLSDQSLNVAVLAPEPTSLSLLALCGVGLMMRPRRRQTIRR